MTIERLKLKDLFFHHFQPIYDIHQELIVGYEALLRSTYYSNPEEMFESAIRENKLFELDSKSIFKAIKTYTNAGFTEIDGDLFINIYPSTLMNHQFQALISELIKDGLVENQRIVFEVNEKEEIKDFHKLNERLSKLKELGFCYALDDFGHGYDDIRKIVELDPDYIKIDRSLIQKLKDSKKHQKIVQNIVRFCELNQIKLVAEGLEYSKDISICRDMGIELGQGYKLGKPSLINITG